MAREEISFTKSTIDLLEPPMDGKRRYIYDTKENGLLVQITGTGRKTFQLYKKHQGRPIRVTIGTFPEYSVEKARKKAREIKAALDAGENPNDKLKQQRQGITFSELFNIYLERHAKPRKRTWQEDEINYKRHLVSLGKKQLSNITKGDIAAIHARIGKEYPTHANRVLALISTIIGRGIEYGLYEGVNPCLGIRRFPEQSRDRFLNGEELSRFFSALEKESNVTARDSFLVALLTGARKENVLSMRWSDIDFPNATWRIKRTKNGTAQTIPLVGPILEILKDRRKSTSSFFVFAGPGQKGHIVSPFKAWVRICKAADLKGIRIHDLRRTMGSWQAKTGASLSIIGKSLNHKSASTTNIYARLDLDPVRTSMDKAVTAMLEAANKK
jgi:integrase